MIILQFLCTLSMKWKVKITFDSKKELIYIFSAISIAMNLLAFKWHAIFIFIVLINRKNFTLNIKNLEHVINITWKIDLIPTNRHKCIVVYVSFNRMQLSLPTTILKTIDIEMAIYLIIWIHQCDFRARLDKLIQT